MKRLANNTAVAKKWYNEGYEGKGSNFYFDGDTIYSYGNHFEIAKRVYINNRMVYLLTSDYYSPTTAVHVAKVRQQLEYNDIICEVPCHRFDRLKEDHNTLQHDTFMGIWGQIKEHADKYTRARTMHKHHLECIARLLRDAKILSMYCECILPAYIIKTVHTFEIDIRGTFNHTLLSGYLDAVNSKLRAIKYGTLKYGSTKNTSIAHHINA